MRGLLERIRRYIAANRAGSGSVRQAVLNLNDKEARLSVAQMVKIVSRHGTHDGRSGRGFHQMTTLQKHLKQKAGSIKPGDIIDWSVTTEVTFESWIKKK